MGRQIDRGKDYQTINTIGSRSWRQAEFYELIKQEALGSLILTLILIGIFWIFFEGIVHAVNSLLNAIDRPMIWSIDRSGFAVFTGLVPAWSYIAWEGLNNRRVGSLITINIASWLILLAEAVMTFAMLAFFCSPETLLIPEKVVVEPFSGFWKYFLLVGASSTAVFILIRKKLFTAYESGK